MVVSTATILQGIFKMAGLKSIGDYLKNHGRMKTENRICEEHGEYTAKSIFRDVWTCCPICQKQKDEQLQAEELEKLRQEAIQRDIAKRLGRSGIAERFQNCQIENYRVDEEIASKAFDNMPKSSDWASKSEKQKEQERQAGIETILSRMNRAKTIAAEYADKFDDVLQTGRCMIFSGLRGTGKNHLACGIAHKVIESGKVAVVITVNDLLQKVKDSFNGGSEKEAINLFVEPDLLVLDEFGAAKLSETDGRILFTVINARYERLKPMLVLTNLSPSDIQENIDGRIRDRLKQDGGKLIPFNWGSYRQAN